MQTALALAILAIAILGAIDGIRHSAHWRDYAKLPWHKKLLSGLLNGFILLVVGYAVHWSVDYFIPQPDWIAVTIAIVLGALCTRSVK